MTGHAIRRREFITLLGGAAAAWPRAARAQQPGRMRRIGVLVGLPENDPEAQARVAALRRGLREHGWIEGRNLRIELRWSTDSIEDIRAAELVDTKPEVLVGMNTPTTQALQRRTTTIPIVFSGPADPIETGLVASLASPGGNTTGFMSFEPAMGGKWMEMLKEVAPRINRLLVMVNPGNAGNQLVLRAIETSAPSIGVEVIPATPRDASEIERAIGSIASESNVGLIAMTGIPLTNYRKLIFVLADRHHLPAIYLFRFFAEDGGLMSYGPDTLDMLRRAASYVDRILKGEKAGDLPVQAPTKFELVVNLKAAKAIGLTIPESFLVRADAVIE
jgi:putative ABC transport system substrate-binding protein